MDLQMPNLDGLQATRQIREGHPTNPTIVALTANVSNEERQRCLAAGMNGYLTKPFKSHELFAAVEGWGAGADTHEPSSRDRGATTVEKPPVDLTGLRSMLADAGIEEVGNKMLAVFLSDSHGRMLALTSAISIGDAPAIAQAAHAFKSGAGNVRAEALAALLQSAEIAGGEGNVDDSRALLPQIELEVERVSDYLRSERASRL